MGGLKERTSYKGSLMEPMIMFWSITDIYLRFYEHGGLQGRVLPRNGPS